MGRKKRADFILPVLIIVGLVISVYSITLSDWGDPSTDWTAVAQNVAGMIGYFFILFSVIFGINQMKKPGPLIFILGFTFLGIVSAQLLGYYYSQSIIVDKWTEYSLTEMKIAVISLFILMSLVFYGLKGRR